MDGLSKLKRKPKKVEDMTREQIKQAIQKKRECNAKAQAIVESLLDASVSEVYFVECLKDINRNHFEDIIEERSITHLCGYPICSYTLSKDDIPKQKYRISMKTNKVYDITTRKNFCSNTCYKAAMYIKNQMLTSPLWFREYEEIPIFNLLSLDTVGSLGQEVDVSLTEKLTKTKEKPFTTLNDFAKMHIQELNPHRYEKNQYENEMNNNTNITEKINPDKGSTSIAMDLLINTEKPVDTSDLKNICCSSNLEITQVKSEKPVKIGDDTNNLEKSNLTIVRAKPLTSKVHPLNIVREIVEKSKENIDADATNQTKKLDFKVSPTNKKVVTTINNQQQTKKELSISVITTQVEKSLAEWFGLDSVFFLLGDEKVKELITDKSGAIKDYITNYANSTFYHSNTYDQYQQLCRRLNILELEDKKFDAENLQQKATRPLPDYSLLQEESKKIKLKVKAFLAGDTEIPVEESVETKKLDEKEDINLPQLPLVDKNAQNALRRRIVYQHLNKVLPDLLRSLGLLTMNISSDVRLLVNTFKLKANNIIFKPIQWTLIAIVMVKLLSLRNPQLEFLLHQQVAYQHLQLLLLSYKQDGGYLDRLVMWLTDINRILEANDCEQTKI